MSVRHRPPGRVESRSVSLPINIKTWKISVDGHGLGRMPKGGGGGIRRRIIMSHEQMPDMERHSRLATRPGILDQAEAKCLAKRPKTSSLRKDAERMARHIGEKGAIAADYLTREQSLQRRSLLYIRASAAETFSLVCRTKCDLFYQCSSRTSGAPNTKMKQSQIGIIRDANRFGDQTRGRKRSHLAPHPRSRKPFTRLFVRALTEIMVRQRPVGGKPVSQVFPGLTSTGSLASLIWKQ
jgi:hypothetical protein